MSKLTVTIVSICKGVTGDSLPTYTTKSGHEMRSFQSLPAGTYNKSTLITLGFHLLNTNGKEGATKATMDTLAKVF